MDEAPHPTSTGAILVNPSTRQRIELTAEQKIKLDRMLGLRTRRFKLYLDADPSAEHIPESTLVNRDHPYHQLYLEQKAAELALPVNKPKADRKGVPISPRDDQKAHHASSMRSVTPRPRKRTRK